MCACVDPSTPCLADGDESIFLISLVDSHMGVRFKINVGRIPRGACSTGGAVIPRPKARAAKVVQRLHDRRGWSCQDESLSPPAQPLSFRKQSTM